MEEIIEATYTEIDCESTIETMRQHTIAECTKVPATLIKWCEEKNTQEIPNPRKPYSIQNLILNSQK